MFFLSLDAVWLSIVTCMSYGVWFHLETKNLENDILLLSSWFANWNLVFYFYTGHEADIE